MKLFTKGLLLIAIPSVLELVVLGTLLDKQRDASRVERWELHSQQVINQAAGIIDPLLRESARVHGAAITGEATPLSDIEPWRELDARLHGLNALVGDDPLALARVTAIRALATRYHTWIDRVSARIGSGDRAQYLPMLAPNNEGDVLMNRMREAISTFNQQEDQLHEERGQSLDQLRIFQKSALVLAALGSLLITVLSAYLFTRHIGLRLAALGENARRVADGMPLPRPVGGRDEISALDAVLHESSQRLSEVELEHRNLSEQLRQRGAELIQVNQHLVSQTNDNETFVYGVSHDLRSPLVNLQGFSKELRVSCASLREAIERSSMNAAQRVQLSEIVDGEIAESLHFLQSAVTRAANIVDALLRLSRAGRLDYQWRQVRTDALVERVVGAMRQTVRERGARIVVGPLPTVWGDATTIEQIFGNLIGNAVNYLDPQRPGLIEIGVLPADWHAPSGAAEPNSMPATAGAAEQPPPASPAPHDASQTANRDSPAPRRQTHVFFVRDNGLGIPALYLPKMFSAFQRLHGNIAKGEGIGLALVRRMVERHEGRVWLESTEGVGSIFLVELPAEPPSGPSPDSARLDGGPPRMPDTDRLEGAR
ncbi:sensor histidine kinase [Pararobbsia alpina]|uniref:histidine kinase n=1 Tax=Pararobbsia alpina TaxID=621374 RepID=A0A6S7BDL3_9BURK|nr:sensor histidine kinase [Pararobbsia alpina]CAB3796682.1 Adaptive-response sensory-kinase SasA [Pararobbsia alpina]